MAAPPTERERRMRRSILFATVFQIVEAERRPARLIDLRMRTGLGRGTILAEVTCLILSRRIKRVATWDHSAGPTDRPRYVYVPADRQLAHGIGFCSTLGCLNDPEMVVNGHPLCRVCSRGPVDAVHGGGQFRTEAAENFAMLMAVAQGRDATQAAGGWEPADGGEKVLAPQRGPTCYTTTVPRRTNHGRSLPTRVPTDLEAEFGL